MTERVLNYEEWHRLPEELDPILADLSPVKSRVCVIEEDGEIVARWILMPVLMAECVWIAPARRGTRVGLRLLDLMKRTARSLGFERVRVASVSASVTKLLANPKLRTEPVPALTFVMQVGKDT
jgi:hypothetical protein